MTSNLCAVHINTFATYEPLDQWVNNNKFKNEKKNVSTQAKQIIASIEKNKCGNKADGTKQMWKVSNKFAVPLSPVGASKQASLLLFVRPSIYLSMHLPLIDRQRYLYFVVVLFCSKAAKYHIIYSNESFIAHTRTYSMSNTLYLRRFYASPFPVHSMNTTKTGTGTDVFLYTCRLHATMPYRETCDSQACSIPTRCSPERHIERESTHSISALCLHLSSRTARGNTFKYSESLCAVHVYVMT